MSIARCLIGQHVFDAYFLDDQIYSAERDEKILAQDELIAMIIESDPLSISPNMSDRHPIYNISTHSNRGGMGKYIFGRCEKLGIAILKIIDDMKKDSLL